jgi:hypothetical protein
MPLTTYPVAPAQYQEATLVLSNPLLFAAGANLYYVTDAEVGVAEATFNLWILKSSDGGATWTRIVNLPQPVIGGTAYTFAAAVQSGSKIWITFTDSSGSGSVPVLIYALDTTTDTFTTSYPAGPIGDYQALLPLPDGTVLIAASTIATSLNLARFNGSTWDATVSLSAIPAFGRLQSVAWDSSRLYLIANGSGGLVQCLTLDAVTLSPSTWQTVYTLTAPVTSFSEFLYSVSGAGTLSILLRVTTATDHQLCALCGPTADSGSLTLALGVIVAQSSLPANAVLGTFLQWPDATLAAVGSTLYCFYCVIQKNPLNSNDNQGLLYYQSSTACGVWSAPTLAYSGPILPTPSELITPYPAAISSSSWAVLFGSINPLLFFSQAPGAKYSSLSVFLLGIAVPAIGSPPSGSTGTAYSYSLVTGGTPPYTIVATVPSCLTLSAAGVLSGTPCAAGTFSFSVQVTDAAGATATATVTLTIYAAVILQLIGWKLYPDSVCEDTVQEVPELPGVKRCF